MNSGSIPQLYLKPRICSVVRALTSVIHGVYIIIYCLARGKFIVCTRSICRFHRKYLDSYNIEKNDTFYDWAPNINKILLNNFEIIQPFQCHNYQAHGMDCRWRYPYTKVDHQEPHSRPDICDCFPFLWWFGKHHQIPSLCVFQDMENLEGIDMWGLKSREEGRMGHLRILQEYYIIYCFIYTYLFLY